MILKKKNLGCRILLVVRFLFFAVLLLCLPVDIPAFLPAFRGTAAAEDIPSAPTLVSTPSPTGGDGAQPRTAPTGTPSAPDLITGQSGTEAVPETVVDVMHAEISGAIQGTATWMDSFFGDRRYQSELNESYVRFRYNVFLEEGSRSVMKPDLQVRIILPQLREKTHLVLSGSPRESTDFSAVQSGGPQEQATTTDQNTVAAGVERNVVDTPQQNFMMRAGAKLHNFKPVLLLGPRYRVLFPLDGWNLRLIEELVWTSNDGWYSRSTVDLERALRNGMFFRASNEWIHKEHIAGFTYAVGFSLGQPLSRIRALDYEWINIFKTEPVDELTEIDLRVRYRQRLWRDWLFLELAPQYRFPRDRDFKATPGILFRLEMMMGKYGQI